MGAKRFRIAFSFAGEKRDFIAKVAHSLAERFGDSAILYDRFHRAEFANADLAFDLPALYKNEAELIVAVFCPDYERKEWCGLEWRAIFSIIKEGGAKQVLLTRFDFTDGKGLHGLGGFIDLDHIEPKEAVEIILERLALNEGKPKDHYLRPAAASPTAPHTSIRHNLPTLQPFFGREDELRKIAAALDPDDRTWGALIDGPGGMGKTSLAVRAAYDASPEDFRRIAFVSLKTRELDDDGVRDLSGFLIPGLAELFNELARELGHAEVAKAPEDQRPRLLLDALRDTQTLLLLDNLESLTKAERGLLFTFVKRLPQGCKAILTARGRIGSGAEELILAQLSLEAALATLAELATRNPALARTSEAERMALYTQTAGKPLLLRWTAGQIGRGQCRTFTDAIAHLRSCPPGNDPLEFIFGDLVDDFSEAETRVLCALTYFTLPARVEHICALAEPISEAEEKRLKRATDLGKITFPNDVSRESSPPEIMLSEIEVENALKSLSNRSLAVPSEDLQTFALVPMVAEFLRKKRPEVVAETGSRLEKRAYALAVENGYQMHDRFQVLDAAWPIVAAALPLFLVGSNDRLQTMCGALWRFLNCTGLWDERLALSYQAESRAEAEGDFLHAGWRAYNSGRIHFLRGQEREVLLCAGRANSHWRRAHAGAREQGFGIRLGSFAHILNKDYPAAIVACHQALGLWRSLASESQEVVVGLVGLAVAEQFSGDIGAAERDYNEALRVALAIGEHEGIADLTNRLAGLALARADWSVAKDFALEALSLSEKVGRQELIATSSHNVAIALVQQNRKVEAIPHARRAVAIFARLGSTSLADACQILAECEA